MKFKVRKISRNINSTYPIQSIEAGSFMDASREYCKNNGFDTPVEAKHSSDDVYTLLSSSASANVIGKFEIWQI